MPVISVGCSRAPDTCAVIEQQPGELIPGCIGRERCVTTGASGQWENLPGGTPRRADWQSCLPLHHENTARRPDGQ